VTKGSYILILYLPEDYKISIGRLGKLVFSKGYYIYVGSAMNSLLGRLKHHLTSKRKHWHIDYLKEKAKMIAIFAIISNKKLESKVSKILSGKPIKNFGSTDTNDYSHLFYYETLDEVFDDIIKLKKILKDFLDYS